MFKMNNISVKLLWKSGYKSHGGPLYKCEYLSEGVMRK